MSSFESIKAFLMHAGYEEISFDPKGKIAEKQYMIKVKEDKKFITLGHGYGNFEGCKVELVFNQEGHLLRHGIYG